MAAEKNHLFFRLERLVPELSFFVQIRWVEGVPVIVVVEVVRADLAEYSAWVADRYDVCGDVFGDYASGADCGSGSYGHSWADRHSGSYPAVVADSDGAGVHVASHSWVDGMADGCDVDIWSEHDMVADGQCSVVDEIATPVDVCAAADLDVGAVRKAERWFHPEPGSLLRADTEDSGDERRTLLHIGGVAGVELVHQSLRGGPLFGKAFAVVGEQQPFVDSFAHGSHVNPLLYIAFVVCNYCGRCLAGHRMN